MYCPLPNEIATWYGEPYEPQKIKSPGCADETEIFEPAYCCSPV